MDASDANQETSARKLSFAKNAKGAKKFREWPVLLGGLGVLDETNIPGVLHDFALQPLWLYASMREHRTLSPAAWARPPYFPNLGVLGAKLKGKFRIQ